MFKKTFITILLTAGFCGLTGVDLSAVDNAYYNSGGPTTRPGRFFIAPQVEIYAAGDGGKADIQSTTPNIVPDPSFSFNTDIGAGISTGYDSYMPRNSWGYTAAFEYMYRPNDASWAFQDITTGQRGTLVMDDSHYFMAKMLGRYRMDRVIPYFGAGAGMGLFTINGDAGIPSGDYWEPVVAGIAGLEITVSSQISFFTEYKYLTTVQDLNIKGGSGLKFQPFGSHIVTIGMKYGF
ncbi:hypothetical protein QPK87_11550 [Kamptonema cortianum]|nr:hypothetical protein [Kamptonema cortianum]